jgi:GNAT superfamily N-acetyltransferase
MDPARLPPRVTIRAIRPADVVPLERFYAELSPDSRDARFHGGARGIEDRAARTFCGPDHVHREGLVAVERQGRRERIVGHLCLEPLGSQDVEMAVAVADAWQHHGIGHALLAAAIDWACTHGFARVRGSIRWSNPAILSLVRTSGRPIAIVTGAEGDAEAVIDIRGELPAAA